MAAVFSFADTPYALISFAYEAAVGISPQEGRVVVAPTILDGVPPAYGSVAVADTTGGPFTLALRDCAVRLLSDTTGPDGRNWTLSLLDRRWRWREGYPIYGSYNELDDRKKLIPRTARSPYQLARLLLTAMGETEPPGGWQIDLPGGLASPYVEGEVPIPGPFDTVIDPVADYLVLGQNLPQTGTNPHVAWGLVPAATALAQVADLYGCVVVWNPLTDYVSVQRVGEGDGLPPGGVPVVSGGASLSLAQVPSKIVVYGAPIVFQTRLLLRPVGRDWDSSWQPLDLLTYAPGNDGDTGRWERTSPGCQTVKPTDRLNYFQALALAQDSVYRTFQVVVASPERVAATTYGPDPATGGGTARGGVIPVPSLAEAEWPTDRFRIVLRDSRPEQVAPRPGDVNRIDPQTGQPYIQDTYTGYSKDSRPRAFAGVSIGTTPSVYGFWGTAAGTDASGSLPFNAPLYVPFRVVDPLRQVVRFDAPLYRQWVQGDGSIRFLPPEHLVIETGCLVLERLENTPIRLRRTLTLGGPAPEIGILRDDCQAEVIGTYDANHKLTGWTNVDADGFRRADYYAAAYSIRFNSPAAAVLQYAGIVPVPLSGQVRQAGWFLSAGGFDTVGSANTEHSPNVPDYPLRRRAENLPVDPVTAARNLAGFGGNMLTPPDNAGKRGGG